MTDKIKDGEPDTPIAELFAKAELTDSDINAIIAKLRTQRSRFAAGDKAAGAIKPTKTSKAQAAATKVTGLLDTDDLGL